MAVNELTMDVNDLLRMIERVSPEEAAAMYERVWHSPI